MTTKKYRAALKAARPIIADDLQREIECNATPEKKHRNGSVLGSGGAYYFNEDTIDEPAARREIRECRRALKLIDEALTAGMRERIRG